MRKPLWDRLRSVAATLIIVFLASPLALAADTDLDGYDDATGADNCPGVSNPGQENTESIIQYDNTQLQVASDTGDWAERFNGDPRTTTFVSSTDFAIGNLIDGSKTVDYEDFWFNHGDEANPGNPAELVVKLPAIGMVTQIVLNNVSAPEDVSDPTYVVKFATDLGDYNDPSFVTGSWTEVPTAGGEGSGTLLSGQEVNIPLANPITARYIKVELVSATSRVTLNEIEIFGNPENVGDACDVCRNVRNADQADSNANCPAPGAGYASDPLCGDICEPLPSIAVADVAVDETDSGTTTLIFSVQLSAARWEVSDDITFDYEVINNNDPLQAGDAEAGVDYVATSGSATISSGAASFDIDVTINGDNVREVDETFTLNVTNIVGNVGDTSDLSATGTITNDDALPGLSIATPASVTEGDAGAGSPSPMVFTFSLTNPSDQDVDFTYTIGNVTTNTSDYTTPVGYGPTSGTATISAYSDSTTITVNIADDTTDENLNETFTVTISSTDDVTIATVATSPDNAATGTIVDEDVPVIVLPGTDPLAFSEGEAAIFIDPTATLATGQASYDAGNLTVDITSGGTANDRLTVVTNVTEAISVVSANVRYSGQTFATWAGGTDGSTPLVITFNANATPSRIQSLMRSIKYQNVSENPTEDTRTVRFALTNQSADASNETTKDINITAVNNAPTLDNIASPAAIDEDTAIEQVVNLTGITTGSLEETQDLAVTVSSSNTSLVNPTVVYTSPDSTGEVRYTIVPDANGTAIITVTVTEVGATENATVQKTFTVAVTAVNDQPVIDDILDPSAINEDASAQTVAFSGVGTGAANEAQTLSITATSSDINIVPNPTVVYTSPNATGSLVYTPVANAHGTATITVTVSDGSGGTETVVDTFDVVVNEVNDAPTINAIASPTAIPEETAVEQTIDLSGIGTGAADEIQTLSVNAVSDNIALIPHPTVTYASPDSTGTLTYTPVADAFGTATITVTVNDGQVANNITVRTFVVTVTAINDQPTLDDITSPAALDEATDTPLTEQTINLTGIGTGSENEDQIITITATSDNTDVILNPVVAYDQELDSTTATLTYTPVEDGNGMATVTVTVSDGGGGTETVVKTFDVVVNAVNDWPTLDDITDPAALPEDTTATQTINISGISTGADNESQTLVVTATSSNTNIIPHPTVNYDQGVDSASGTLTFVPVFDRSGTATVTVTVTELGALQNGTVEKTFTVTVNEINDQPTLDPIGNPVAIDEDTIATQTINLTNITSGSENEAQDLIITVTSNNTDLIEPTRTYISPQNTGTITYVPKLNANGTATITVTVSDGSTENSTVTRTFDVTVNPVNDTPTLNAIPDPTAIGEDVGEQTITLSGIGTGAGNEVQTLSITATSNNTDVIPDPTVTYTSPEGTAILTYTSVLDSAGTSTINVTVDDGQGINNTTVQTFDVVVNATNDRPTLDTIEDISVDEDSGTMVVNLTGISTGSPTEVQNISIVATSSDPSIIPHPPVNYISPNISGTLSFTPLADANGTVTISVSVTEDGATENNTVVQEFVITVNAVNDQPTLNAIPDPSPITEDSTALQTINIYGIGTGAANETQALTVTTSSSDISIIPNPTVNYTSANAFGTLSYTAAPDGYGTAVITVTVSDGQTANATISKTFNVQVVGVNNPPTLDVIDNPAAIDEDSGEQTINLAGITSGAVNEDQTLTITATSSDINLIPDPTITYTSADTTGTLTYTPVADANGTATITVTVNDGGGGAETVVRTFDVEVTPVNDYPTLDTISDPAAVDEDAPEQTINLAGISSGQPDETSDNIVITATSSDTSIIPDPTVTYTSQETTGTLTYTPVADAHGTVTITVTVTENGVSVNDSITKTFDVTVNPINDAPTVDAVTNPAPIGEDTIITQTITLSGITTGAADEIQDITVAAASSNTGIIPNPTVTYTSPNNTAILSYVPVEDAHGTSTITVTITEPGAPENDTTQITFDIEVAAINDRPTVDTIATPAAINEDAPQQTVNLSGISTGATNENQIIVITATSSNTSVIPTPTVTYTSPGTTGAVNYTPVADAHGTATITVLVEEVGATQNVSTIRTFDVTVNPVNDQPTIDTIDNPPAVAEGVGEQTVNFSGVGTGAVNETQDLVVTASSNNISIIPDPTVTYLSPEATGTFTYTPVAEAYGTATITVTVSDGGTENATVVETFDVTVSGVNNAPTLDPIADPTVIDEDASEQTINVSGISTGSVNEDQTLVVTATSSDTSIIPDPTVTYTSPNATGTLAYAPVADAHGSVTITVTVNDGGGGTESFSQAFTVVVNPVNDQPTLDVVGPSSLNEDTGEQTVNLSGISTGADNEVQDIVITAVSDNEAVIPNPVIVYTSPDGTGSLVYTPVPDQYGDATITITVTEPGATENGTLIRNFDVTVSLTNDAPTLDAIANPAAIDEDASQQTINLSGISTGAANEVQTLLITATSSDTSIIPDPTVSYTSPNATGTLTYTPVADAHGTATITVTVAEIGATENATVVQTFDVTVNAVNDQPTLDAITSPAAIDEDTTATQTINITNISTGAGNETQDLIITATSSDTGIIPDPTINYTPGETTGTLTYVPLFDAYGSATVTVTITEDGATENPSITQTFIVAVTAINDQPTLDSIADPAAIDEDTAFVPAINLTGISTGSLLETQTLVVTATSSDTSIIPDPTVTYTSADATGSLSYVPVANAFGTATITVTVSDGGGGLETIVRTFDVVVNALNDQPTLDAITSPSAINEDNTTQQIIDLTGITSGSDQEDQTITVTAFSNNPSLITNPVVNYTSPNTTGTLTYSAVADAYGTATITVVVSDGGAANDTRTRTFDVVVNAVNDQPTLGEIADPASINEDASTQTINITGITTGSINEAQDLVLTATSSNTSIIPDPTVIYVSPEGTATLEYAPVANASGTATITVTLSDGEQNNATISRSFDVTVTPVNDQPTLDVIPNPAAIIEGAIQQTISLTGISSGAADENQTITIVASSSDTSIIPNPTVTYSSPDATATLSYVPVADAFGAATITVSLSDNGGGNQTIIRTFVVQVDEDNDLPTLNPIADPVALTEDDTSTQTINLTGISTGAANEIQTIIVTATSDNPGLVQNPTVAYTSPNATGTLTYAAVADNYGSATITVTVTDSGVDNNVITEIFTVVVNSVNDQPTLDVIANPGAIDEDAAEQTVNLAGITTGSIYETQTLTVTATSSNTSLIPDPTITYTSPEATGTLTYTPVPDANGTATITVTVSDGGGGTETIVRTFDIVVNAINDWPTLDGITDPVAIMEDAATQTIDLTGISVGALNENQSLTITATSDNTAVIPNPTVTYASPTATGTLSYRPILNTYGTATITVTVTESGATENNVIEQTFTVVVNSINDQPTLDSLQNMTIAEDASWQNVNLTGIGSGSPDEPQDLIVTATSSNTALIQDPTVTYTSPDSTGTISFAPLPESSGVTTITVTVEETGAGENAVVQKSFTVTVESVNDTPTLDTIADPVALDEEDTSTQAINLSGIGTGAANEAQTITITATSDNQTLLPNGNITVNYTSADATGTLTYTIAPDASGTATVTVTANDGSGGAESVSQNFTVMVNAINDQPTLSAIVDPAAINEDALMQTINLSNITTGSVNESQTLVVTATSSDASIIPDPTVTYISPASTATLTYTPVANNSGTAIITVIVSDGGIENATVTQTFNVVVNAVNDFPTLDAITNPTEIIEGDANQYDITLTGVSTGAINEDQTLTVTATSSNTSIVEDPSITYVSPNTTGTLTYSAVPDAYGTTTITVTVSDGVDTTSQAFDITVGAVNDQPTLDAIADPAAIDEESGEQTINLTGITSGAANEDQNLVVTAVSDNTALIPNPTVTYTSPNTTGTLTYTPVADAFGTTTITVTVSDGQQNNGTVQETFVITVNAINDQPTLNAISNPAVIDEDASEQTISLAGIGPGSENETQTLLVTAVSSNTELIPNPTVTYVSPNATATLAYTPVADAFGTATITVTVSDGEEANGTIEQTFTVNVDAVNDDPTIDPIADPVSILEGASEQTINLSGISGGAANEGETITVTATSSDTSVIPNPTVTYTSPDATATLAYAPVSDAWGIATITVEVDDGTATMTQTFDVTVDFVNDVPTLNAIADPAAIDEDSGQQSIGFTGVTSGAANEDQELTVTATSSDTFIIPDPTVTYISSDTNGSLSYTPIADAYGTTTITVTVSDGIDTISETFDVTVNPINDAPTLDAITDPLAISEDASEQTINLAGITTGQINEDQTLTITATSSNTAVILGPTVTYISAEATGTLTYTPVADAYGTATITVTLSDGGTENATVVRTFEVVVNAVNDQPTLEEVADPEAIAEDSGQQTIDLSGIGTGADDENQTLTLNATSDNTSIIPNPTVTYTSPNTTGTLTYTPVANAYGTATITITVSDGGGVNNTITRTFQVVVDPVNDIPTLDAIANPPAIDEDAPEQTVNLSGIATGAANEVQTITIVATSSDTSVIPDPSVNYTSPNASGTLTYTPVLNAAGTATITVTLSDGGGENTTVVQTFDVTVNEVNDAPTLDEINDLDLPENAGTQTVTLTGISTGAANETQEIQITAVSSNTSVVSDPVVTYTSPAETATLSFSPLLDAYGLATITVTVTEVGATENATIQKIFGVAVNYVNTAPTFDAIETPSPIVEDTTAQQTINLSGITSGAVDEEQTLTVSAISSNTNIIPNPTVTYTSPNTTATLTYTPLPNASGLATVTVTVSDNGGGAETTTQSFDVIVTSVNDQPTLDAIENPTVINENAGEQSVALTGITSGATNEVQVLAVTATSSNPSLIPDPTIIYTSPDPTATLTYAPVLDANGTATITVTVSDNNGGNETVTQTFTITVSSSNNQPTLDAIEDLTIAEDAEAQSVDLTGISTGAFNEEQTLIITATSSDTSIILDPTVNYTSPDTTGTLVFAPVSDASGTVTITVTVSEDGAEENGSVVRSFNVIVTAVNDVPTIDIITNPSAIDEDSTITQTINLTGISTGAANEEQELVITAQSSDTSVIPHPTVTYTSPEATGTLTYTPVSNGNGTATVTVTITDGSGQNGTTTQTFDVAVLGINDAPTFDAIPAQEAIIGADFTLDIPSLGLNPTDIEGDAMVWSVEITNDNVDGDMAWPDEGEIQTISAGVFKFVPNALFTGKLEVAVTLTDNGVTNSIFDFKTFTRNVTLDWQNNSNPVLNPSIQSAYAADEDTPIVITLTDGDKSDLESPDAQLTWSIENFENGTASIEGNTITFTPNANFNMNDEVEVVTLVLSDPNGGRDTKTLNLTWNPINDAPVFTVQPLLEVLEDSGPQGQIWATNIAAGPSANEAESLATNFTIVANTNPELFSAGPTLASTGILTFTPAENVNGEASITVTLSDNGTMGGAHVNVSTQQTFTIRVFAVNDAPTYTLGADQTVAEDAGAQSVSGFATEISAGPTEDETSQQTLSGFVVLNNTDPSLFAAGPAISLTGTLTFTPAADATGSADITVAITDSGGTENDGINGSLQETFTITVAPVNDAPTFSTITEKSVPIGEAFNLNLNTFGVPQDKEGDPLTWTVDITNESVGGETVWAGSVTETAEGSGIFTFDPVNGSFDGKIEVSVTLTDDGTPSVESTTQTGLIIDWLNNTNPVILEALETSYSIGEGNNLVIELTDGDKSDVEDIDGDLVWSVAGFTAGTVSVNGNTITLNPTDDNYSVTNASATLILTDTSNGTDTIGLALTWTSLNDAPTFTKGDNVVVNEDSGVQNILGWATNISAGPNESGQTLNQNFTIVDNTNPGLFGVAPTITNSGTLNFSPLQNMNGSADITIQISDNGANDENGNVNTSDPQTFTITVNPVNDAPSFTKGSNQYVEENSGVHTVAGWATNISKGASNESGQTLTFNIISNSNEALFASGPTIDPATGALDFTLNEEINGEATISITLSDDGGTANGGFNTSTTKTFTINVAATNLVNYTGTGEVSIEVNSTQTGSVSLEENITHVHLSTTQNLNLSSGVQAKDTTTTEVNGTNVKTTLESVSGKTVAGANLKSVTLQSGTDGTNMTISSPDSQIEIPDGVTIYASEDWDGTIAPPGNVTSASANDPDYDVNNAVEVGSTTETLIFDKPVKVVVPSTDGVPIYRPDASSPWQPIPNICADIVATGLAFPDTCYIKTGGETFIWTHHLSQFGMGQAYPICGNGKIEAPEQCDDGNLTLYDGCDNECQTEEPTTSSPGATSSGKAATIRYAGMSRDDLQIISGAGVSKDDFEDAYQASMEQIAKMNEGYEASIRKIVKRGEEVFVGYQAGKLPVDRLLEKTTGDRMILRGIGRERARRHATAPKLMPQSTTMNITDVDYNDKYYADIAKMISLELMDINSANEFRPDDPLSWSLLLNASIRAQSNEIQSQRELEEENLPVLETVELTSRLKDRIFYTALRDGFIDQSFNPGYLPTQGKTIFALCRAFELVSFEDDVDMDTCLEAAVGSGILNTIEARNFNPDVLTTREAFAHWFSRGYAKQEKELELDSFKKRQQEKGIQQEDFFRDQIEKLKNRDDSQASSPVERIGSTLKEIFSL